MCQPAACIGDSHTCPIVSPHLHVGGKILGPGAPSIHINGRTAAVLGDDCFCEGAANIIIRGSPSVYFSGRPAARHGDQCAHGGTISSGCASVLIGGTMPDDFPIEQFLRIDPASRSERQSVVKKFHLPSPARRNKMLARTIRDAIDLLFKKLRLLHQRDETTMQLLELWFGRRDEVARRIICMRIINEIKLLKKTDTDQFGVIKNNKVRKMMFALIEPDDALHTVYLGDPFWSSARHGKDSKAGILIHELSHFPEVGNTNDHMYEESGCIALAKQSPQHALYNADSFEYFIES